MADDRWMERYVEEESAKALQSWAWFIRRPVWLRLCLSFAFAVSMAAASAGAIYGLFASDGSDPLDRVMALLGFVVGMAVFGPLAVWHAVNPTASVRRAVREGARFPTNAPGYGVWHGDDDRKWPRSH